MVSFHSEVTYSGEMQLIHDLYRVLGAEATDAGVKFHNFEIIYVDKSLEADVDLVVEIDRSLDVVEKAYSDLSVPILTSGFDASGPFIVAMDPSGRKVRIGLSSDGLVKCIKSSKI